MPRNISCVTMLKKFRNTIHYYILQQCTRVLNPVKQLGWSFLTKTSKTVNYFGKKALSQIFDRALKTPTVLMVNNSDKSDLGQ